MSMSDSVERKEKKDIQKLAHPAIGEIYCLNEAEARRTLHEICTDKLYFQEGISILPEGFHIPTDFFSAVVSCPFSRSLLYGDRSGTKVATSPPTRIGTLGISARSCCKKENSRFWLLSSNERMISKKEDTSAPNIKAQEKLRLFN
jgi:hypothetical protein